MQNYALVKQVELLASKKGVTPGQLALAWVHSQGDDVFPIPGKANPLQGAGNESEGLGVVERQELLVHSSCHGHVCCVACVCEGSELCFSPKALQYSYAGVIT